MVQTVRVCVCVCVCSLCLSRSTYLGTHCGLIFVHHRDGRKRLMHLLALAAATVALGLIVNFTFMPLNKVARLFLPLLLRMATLVCR